MWFEAGWLMTSTTTGTSAVNVQRLPRLGSYQLQPGRRCTVTAT
jgi:hypothetical protein